MTLPPAAAELELRAARLEANAAAVRRKTEVELDVRALLVELWESTPMSEQRYIADELAIVLDESSRTTQTWVGDAVGMSCYPELQELVTSGTWSVRHADAVLDEIAGLDREMRRKVLDLVLAQKGARTPHELRKAARAAVYLVDPDAAERAAEKAKTDRGVTQHDERNGAGSLVMTGPKAAVASALAGLDALCAVPQPGDTRTLLQRRFDTLMDLITGRQTAVGGSVMLLVSLASLQGESAEPGLIPGVGHVTASEAREIVADAAEIRRVVVDGNGELVSADSTVNRPEPVVVEDAAPLVSDAIEPDPVVDDEPMHEVSDEEWLATELPDLTHDLAKAEQDYIEHNTDSLPLPGNPAWEAGQAHLRSILATLQEQQTLNGRRVADAHVKIETDGTVRVHWDNDPEDPHDPWEDPPPDGGSGPPGPPTQPLPAGWVDDRHATRVAQAGTALPSDRREAATGHHHRWLRRSRPSWVTHTFTFDELALLDPYPPGKAPTSNDLEWWSNHPDHTLAHHLVNLLAPRARRLPTPDGGWPTRSPTPPAWSPQALDELTAKLLTKPVTPPPADSSSYLFRGAMRRHIQLRDRTCRFPSCPRLARHCEIDHRREWPVGPTSIWNGTVVCDPHHDAKHAVLTLTRLPDGTFRWTLRTGHYADVPPRPLLRGW